MIDESAILSRHVLILPPPDPSYPDEFGGELWVHQDTGDDRIEVQVRPTAPGNYEGVRLTPANVRELMRFLHGEGEYA